jgi:hypothetical protein
MTWSAARTEGSLLTREVSDHAAFGSAQSQYQHCPHWRSLNWRFLAIIPCYWTGAAVERFCIIIGSAKVD